MQLRLRTLRNERAGACEKGFEWQLRADKLQELWEATDWVGAGSLEQCARSQSPHL